MQKLCFKHRKGAHTVQLVRHAYCPSRKRSHTKTLGSFPRDADPEDFRPDLRLAAGVQLSEEELQQVADWLRQHGDPAAAERRRATVLRIENQVRENLRAASASGKNVFERAKAAMLEAARELPVLAKALREQDDDVWKALRPRYMELFASWDQFQRAAQAAGVMKRKGRGGGAETEDI